MKTRIGVETRLNKDLMKTSSMALCLNYDHGENIKPLQSGKNKNIYILRWKIEIVKIYIITTVPTEHNLKPERTQSEPRVRFLGSLWVRYELAFKNFPFALG
jgi:hypothetical protein